MTDRLPRLAIALTAAALLAACASKPGSELPATAAAPAAATPAASQTQTAAKPDSKPDAKPDAAAGPLLRHEAAAQCWMKLDRVNASLDAKAKLVGKCIDEKMKAAKH
jgi:pectin methylesterase-like acyl-CoA thioesterase